MRRNGDWWTVSACGIGELKERVRAFVAERDWDRFHSPSRAMALLVEASKLVELFQWLTEAESASLDGKQRQRVAEELADGAAVSSSCLWTGSTSTCSRPPS